MRYFLTGLKVDGFRGINNEGLPLELTFKADHLNTVFAVNGAGKSSIFEALRFAITGSVPRLDRLNPREEAADYYLNAFHSGRRARIELTFVSDGGGPEVMVLVTLDDAGNRAVSSPTGFSNPSELLQQLSGHSVFIDSQTFQSFVEDTPLLRGRSFSALVGLAPLSQMRQALELLANSRTLNTDFDLAGIRSTLTAATADEARAEAALTRLYDSVAGAPLTAPIDTADIRQKLKGRLASEPTLSGSVSSTADPRAHLDFESLRAAVRDAEDAPRRARFAVLVRDIADLEEVSERIQAPDDSELQALAMARAAALSATRGANFGALHQQLDRLLREPEWLESEECPACLELPATPIREVVRGVLARYSAATIAHDELKLAWRSSALRADALELEELSALSVPQESRRANAVATELESAADIPQLLRDFKQHVVGLKERLDRALLTLRTERDEISATLPESLVALTQLVEAAAQLWSACVNLDGARSRKQRAESELRSRQRWIEFVMAARDDFASAEVALSTSRVVALEETYRQLYQQLVGHAEVVPKLVKSDTSEELFLKLEQFYGSTGVPAPAVLSESYRNALAISIFLAATLHSPSACGFMVFDDITSSFDAGHQFNLMEVLLRKVCSAANGTGPQVVLLSHDGLMQKYFDSALSRGEALKHVRLTGAPPRGPVLVDGVSGDRIRAAAEAPLLRGDVDQGGPFVRQYLEQQLVLVINRVGIPVPIDFAIRDDRKMVSNCISAIEAAVKLQKAAGGLVLSAVQEEELRTSIIPSLIGNWVSHIETASLASFSAPVLLGVLGSVDKFVDCFRYDCTCQGSAKRRFYKSLTRRACTCA